MFSLSPITSTTPPRNPQPFLRTLEHVTAGYRSMLDATSALNPITPMVFDPGAGTVAPNFTRAITDAAAGIAAIELALGTYPVVRNEARTAIETAAVEARRGYDQLRTELTHGFRVDTPGIVAAFDAAATLLHSAGELLARELRDPNGFRPFGTH